MGLSPDISRCPWLNLVRRRIHQAGCRISRNRLPGISDTLPLMVYHNIFSQIIFCRRQPVGKPTDGLQRIDNRFGYHHTSRVSPTPWRPVSGALRACYAKRHAGAGATGPACPSARVSAYVTGWAAQLDGMGWYGVRWGLWMLQLRHLSHTVGGGWGVGYSGWLR